MNISGITPAAIEILHIYIKMGVKSRKSADAFTALIPDSRSEI
jgi:hypothetical protein